jgi:hypothetical protein
MRGSPGVGRRTAQRDRYARWMICGFGLMITVWSCAIPAIAAAPSASEAATAATESPGLRVGGVVTLNGQLAPAGVGLILLGAAPESAICAETTTSDGGVFSVDVRAGCPEGTAYVIRLSELNVMATNDFVMDPRNTSITAAFTGLTEDQLATLGVPSTAGGEALLDGDALTDIMILVIMAAAVALVYIVRRGPGDDVSRQTEAIVLLAVVIAVIILGITAKISGDGLISVLSAIIGWTAGRAAASRGGTDGG